MPLDAITIAAVADEIRQTCLGGRIQAVFLPAPLSVGLEIYTHRGTHYLFASAHPQHARVHLAEGKLSRGSEDVTPLLLLLRRYVRDGRLAGVEQPALERTLTLIITKADVFDKGRDDKAQEHAIGGQGEPSVGPLVLTTTRIVIEIMGRYSNIVLVDEAGAVMEAVKHIPSEINRYRVTLPRHPYVLPPPQNKQDPRGVSPQAVAQILAAAREQPLWQTLVSAYAGISPLLAREIVFRAAGSASALGGDVPADALASALSHLLSIPYSRQWSPTIVRDGNSIVNFAPYELTQYAEHAHPIDSISRAIHEYYVQETVAADYAGIKQQVAKSLASQRQRVLKRQESLRTQQAMADQADDLRTRGEMLLAYAAGVTPGQSSLIADMGEGQPTLHITLDPRLTAVENAQKYFKRYVQARDAARSLPALLQRVTLDLAYLDQLELDLALAETASDIRGVTDELGELNGPKPVEEKPSKGRSGQKDKRSTDRRPPPLSVVAADGTTILIGRNARQNDTLTFELASPLDTWLHARGVPGSHVIIRSGGRPVSAATLHQAAALAAAYSAARASTTVIVAYTQRRHVRRIKGGGPGLVTVSNEQTIQVRPAPLPHNSTK